MRNLANSVRPGHLTAAKLDRIRSDDAAISGAITRNDFEDKVNGGGSRLGRLGGYSTATKHDFKARVRIDGGIVSPETGEVLTAAEGCGEVTGKERLSIFGTTVMRGRTTPSKITGFHRFQRTLCAAFSLAILSS